MWENPLLVENFSIIKKFLENFVYQGKGLPVVNLLDHRKMFAYWKPTWSNKILCLQKTTLMMKKPLLVENFLNRGKIRKTSLIMEIFVLVESFLDHRKISESGKRPWLWKNFCFWISSLIKEKSLLLKHFLIMEKCLLLENVFDCGKIPWSSLLRMKLFRKRSTNVETMMMYIYKFEAKT